MECGSGYHETELRSLFGSALTPTFDDTICAPDPQRSCNGIFECAVDAFAQVKGGELALATVQSVGQVAAFIGSSGTSVLGTILSGVGSAEGVPELRQTGAALAVAESAYNLGSSWEDTMGFFDTFDFDLGSVSGAVDWAADLVDEVPWGDVADFGQTAFQAYNQYAVPVKGPQGYGGNRGNLPAPVPGTGQGGVLGGMLRTGPVGRSFFNKWPNLATAIQKMRNAGQNVSRSKLYSMLKRFGPDFLITAGILTAAGVSELALAGPGHRRMNPANSKALRRAQRRLKSFHRLCSDSDVLKSRRRSCAKKC